MAIALSDLLQELTKEGLLADFLEIAKALRLPVTAWQTGEPIYSLLVIFAERLSKLWNLTLVKAIRAWFLDYATGEWLSLVAWAFYGVSRKGLTFATVSLVVENRGGGFYTFVPGDLRASNGSKTFTSTTGGVLAVWTGSGPYPTVTITFQADEAGSGSSTPVAGIQAYPTAPNAAPTNVYMQTNGLEIVGQDAESDDRLVARCRLSTGPLSPASPRNAYEWAALSVRKDALGIGLLPGDDGYDLGTALNVTRARLIEPGNCTVALYLASDTGAAAGDTSTAGTDVFIVNVTIQTRIVPAGITATVAAATEVPITYNATLDVNRASKVTAADAQAGGESAVSSYFAKLPVGGYVAIPGWPNGYVFREAVDASATLPALGVFRVNSLLAGGTADVALQFSEVAVPTLTIAAVLVSQ